MMDLRTARPGRDRRVMTLAIAVALHAAGVGALLWGGHAVMNAAPEEIVIRFPVAPKLGGGDGHAAAPEATPVRKAAKPAATPEFAEVQPIPDPTATPEIDDRLAVLPETGLGEGTGIGPVKGPGVPDGNPESECIGDDCVTGGLPGGPNPIPDATALGIVPVPIFQPSPRYPAAARSANLTGQVVLEIIVGVDGRVLSAKVVRSRPPFDAAALDTVRLWRYKPVIVGGRPIVWKSSVNLKFELR